MCKLDDENDQFLTSLINSYIIGKVLVPFDIEYDMNKKALTNIKTFGKSIRRLSITMKCINFNALAKFIIEFFSPDRINELQVTMCDKRHYSYEEIDIDWELMHRAIPYFRSIKHLQIHGSYIRAFGDFCLFLINQAKNLESLKLANLKWEKHVNHIQIEGSKLKELRIVGVLGLGHGVLDHFIKNSPQLEVFEFENESMQSLEYGETLAKYCPNLRFFSDMSYGLEDDVYYYHFLKHFNHLEEATISLGTMEADWRSASVEILINKNSLKKLTMFVNKKCRMVLTDSEPDNCTKLSTKLTDAEFHFEVPWNIVEWKELLQSCRSLFARVRKISLSGSTVHNIPEILQHTPHVEEIRIYELFIHQLPAEVRKIKRIIGKIVENRHSEGQTDKVRLVVDQDQIKEFKVLKNIDQLVTLSEIKSRNFYCYR